MSTEEKPAIQVLFVDDDRSFLELAKETFGELSQGAWKILCASDAAATSTLLQENQVDLVVLDVRMPEISGLQLIGILQREHPDIPKVFLAGVVEEAERVAGLESGAALYLEKPTDYAAVQTVFATLSELLKWQQKRGGSGATRAGILDLVKLECSAKNSRVFEVFNSEVRGLIYIQEGAIIHAESPGRRGQSAFSYLTTLLDAEFHLRQFVEAPERSILRQWEFLYLEAVQLREQLQQVAAEAKAKAEAAADSTEPEPSATATKPDSPAAKAASAPPAAAPPATAGPVAEGSLPPGVTDEEATRQLFRRPGAKPAETETAEGVRGVGRGGAHVEPLPPAEERLQLRMMGPGSSGMTAEEASEAERTAAKPTGPRATLVHELLVCSYKAEVLYAWQCPRAEERMQFVEKARERSDRLSQHLPLGPADRLELQAATGRMVVRFDEDGAVLMRTTSGVEPGEPGPGQMHQSMAGWLARHTSIRGLLAAGVLRPKRSLSQTVSPEFASENLGVAWRCIQEILELAPTHGLDPWQLRWVFERAQVYVTRRTDGQALAMFLSKEAEMLDATAIERIFNEFKSLEAA